MEAKLNLSYLKPLAFIKVQTTGLNSTTDRIIELSITRIDIDGQVKNGTRLINPEMPIPSEATALNGITDDMVKNEHKFKDIAAKMSEFLDGCDFVGFNISHFDLKFLSEEFNRAGIEFTLLGRKVIDISNIYHAMEPRDFSSAMSLYCDKKVEKLSSKDTTQSYFELLNGMMAKYSGKQFVDKSGKSHGIEASVESINNLFNKNKKQLDIEGNIVLNEAGRPILTKGKYKDKILSDVLLSDGDYYDWLINASTFPADTKLVIKKIYEKAKSVAVTK